ncbi:hypothetical protein MVUOKPPV_CDS0271 [Klebsiella phage phi1_175008]|uniref:Uncharacterized protein n=1 Tax=Klebsiella phage phi1_175008 TaxID=3127744 RepID=A0ACD5FS40_9CAUD
MCGAPIASPCVVNNSPSRSSRQYLDANIFLNFSLAFSLH